MSEDCDRRIAGGQHFWTLGTIAPGLGLQCKQSKNSMFPLIGMGLGKSLNDLQGCAIQATQRAVRDDLSGAPGWKLPQRRNPQFRSLQSSRDVMIEFKTIAAAKVVKRDLIVQD